MSLIAIIVVAESVRGFMVSRDRIRYVAEISIAVVESWHVLRVCGALRRGFKIDIDTERWQLEDLFGSKHVGVWWDQMPIGTVG